MGEKVSKAEAEHPRFDPNLTSVGPMKHRPDRLADRDHGIDKGAGGSAIEMSWARRMASRLRIDWKGMRPAPRRRSAARVPSRTSAQGLTRVPPSSVLSKDRGRSVSSKAKRSRSNRPWALNELPSRTASAKAGFPQR